MQSVAQSGFQSDSSGFESRRPCQFNYEFQIKLRMQRDLSFVIRNLKFVISNLRVSPSGLRRWSAKPIIIGSNPIARSKFLRANAENDYIGKSV